MDNQHKLIRGYRDLSQAEIDLMNDGKGLAEQVRMWLEKCEHTVLQTPDKSVDPRWINIARTQLQQGFMAAIRAIAKPTTF